VFLQSFPKQDGTFSLGKDCRNTGSHSACLEEPLRTVASRCDMDHLFALVKDNS
jgi:hypothetical protein